MKKVNTVLAAGVSAVLFGLSGASFAVQSAVPWEGIIDVAGDSMFDVYYQVVFDPNSEYCNTGPLADCNPLGSPAIAKQDAEEFTEGPAYTSQEFTLSDGAFNDTTQGTWSYINAPKYVTGWSTKDGSNTLFAVFYLVDDGTTLDGDTSYKGYTADTGVLYPWLAVNSCTQGDTTQPSGSDACTLGGLSNIVWFDTDAPNPPEEIPEPGSLALLGLAVVGMGFVGGRRRKD